MTYISILKTKIEIYSKKMFLIGVNQLLNSRVKCIKSYHPMLMSLLGTTMPSVRHWDRGETSVETVSRSSQGSREALRPTRKYTDKQATGFAIASNVVTKRRDSISFHSKGITNNCKCTRPETVQTNRSGGHLIYYVLFLTSVSRLPEYNRLGRFWNSLKGLMLF